MTFNSETFIEKQSVVGTEKNSSKFNITAVFKLGKPLETLRNVDNYAEVL